VRAPVLLLVASDDVLAPATTAHDALARMPPTCALVELPGGHFDVYDAWYERSRDAAVGWFRRWLGHAPA
jgi:pimeloyl-ACP methyl ester carboxylesterase